MRRELGHADALGRYLDSGREESLLDDVVRANEALVRLIVKEYFGGYRINTEDYEDVLQVGRLGVFRAAKRYNANLGSFSRYASFGIWQNIHNFLEHDRRLIRLPEWFWMVVVAYDKAVLIYMLEYGRKPTPARLAHMLDCEVNPVERIHQHIHQVGGHFLASLSSLGSDTDYLLPAAETPEAIFLREVGPIELMELFASGAFQSRTLQIVNGFLDDMTFEQIGRCVPNAAGRPLHLSHVGIILHEAILSARQQLGLTVEERPHIPLRRLVKEQKPSQLKAPYLRFVDQVAALELEFGWDLDTSGLGKQRSAKTWPGRTGANVA